MTDGDVLPYVQNRLPGFSPVDTPIRLPEGNLNLVWRVIGEERSVIVKYAPPYIATAPDVPLDPSRLSIEARCLEALSPDGELASIAGAEVRAPHLLHVDEDANVLVMEDLGDLPTLDRRLRDSKAEDLRSAASLLGERLGAFIGRLHATTHGRATYEEAFENRPMQETRHAVQYQGVTEMLERGDVSDAEVLGARAEGLGEGLLEPGRCLTMGDLWPASVLVEGDEPRLIDWELAHYGRPLQDVAHWWAHLWMQEHRAPRAAVEEAVAALRSSFLDAYQEPLGAEKKELWTAREKRDAAVHFGAEILVRAVGPFQEGYVYAGLPPDHPAVQEAVHAATQHLRHPDRSALPPL